jgi:hypothetical protein
MLTKGGFRSLISLLVLGLASGAAWCYLYTSEAKEKPATPRELLERRFTSQVRPFLERYCQECHGPKKQKAALDLSRDSTMAAVVKNYRQWGLVFDRLKACEMPPEGATRLPEAAEREAVIAWIRDLREHETVHNAGDPGIVLAHRLSNAEYDYTIRDLTGVDIRPTREFPVDPANEPGFDNSGESLTMSPALLKKYLAAARHITDHLVLKPNGFVFAPHPAVTDTDRDKYCVQRIMDFSKRHNVDLADYFFAVWRFQHRDILGKPKASLSDIANDAGLSAKYLATLWTLLAEKMPSSGPIEEVQTEWRRLPSDAKKQTEVRRECERLRDLVLRLRKGFPAKVEKLQVKGISQGSQPLLLWRNDQLAGQHMKPPTDNQAVARFCRVFPDAFAVVERGPYYDPGSSPKGRLLSAGFHLMHGFYRDDGPLYELILDDKARRELDKLWEELHFITLDQQRQYKDFIFFERAEPPRYMREAAFDFARSEDKDAISEGKMDRLAKAYLAKAVKQGASAEAQKAISGYFTSMSAAIRKVERDRLAAEPSHLESLLAFAERAYRRPLTETERRDLLAFYRTLRKQDEMGHEEALRDTLVTVLMSPQFSYRLITASTKTEPLTDYELASRLSFFLWSSMPDAELQAHAKAGDLHRQDVLTAQAQRMLRDPRVRGLAREFAGNWLDFRRFEEHNSVDRQRFPSFTNELRQAMFEEPVRYFTDIAQRNRSILDLLHGNDTFVNRPLANHYGMPEPRSDKWVHIEDAGQYGRGGILPMAVFQTKNAPGLRTSPVKRGYWVVRRVLGEEIPPPPPTVPELPKDEAKLGELTLPQVLARHRADKSCAGCHRRFDSVGLVFEDFGPIGERRTKDLGGRPVLTEARFPDGKDRTGLKGLRNYLHEKRQNDFVDNLCGKLFSYALGRSLTLSDRKALDAMRMNLTRDGYTFSSLVESIITSPQFLNKRPATN